MHHSCLEEACGSFLADAIDIHHTTAYKVLDPPYYLRLTPSLVGTYPRSLALDTKQGRATRRTMADEFYGTTAGTTLR